MAFVVEDIITFDHGRFLTGSCPHVHISRAVTEAQRRDFVFDKLPSVNSLTITASRRKISDTHHLPCLEFLDLHDNEINHLNCGLFKRHTRLRTSNNCIKRYHVTSGHCRTRLRGTGSQNTYTLRHHIDTTVNYSGKIIS
jgi:hypothetical protein